MNKIKRIIFKVSERPRLVLACSILVCNICGFFLIFSQPITPTVIINFSLCLLSIILDFIIILKNNNFRTATIFLFLITPASIISFFFLFTSPFYVLCILLITIITILSVPIIKKLQYLHQIHFTFAKYKKNKHIYKVSAIIPNYNYADYLEERVKSIISQTYPIHELIFLDDCSTDNSNEIINKIIANLKIEKPNLVVKYYPNTENSGNVFKQWQKGFELSTGDFVWICEADDSSNKHFLNAVMRAFDDPNVILSYSETKLIDEKGALIANNTHYWTDAFNTGHWNHSFVTTGKNELQKYLCINNTIPNVSGVVFRKHNLNYKKYLKKAENFKLAGDWYFYSKILLNGKLAFCCESLNYRRLQPRGLTLSTDYRQQFQEIVTIQESIKKDVKLSKTTQRKVDTQRKKHLKEFDLSEDELKYSKIPFSKLVPKHQENTTLLSIIVTAYNREKYLEECLISIADALPPQTEVLIIDDGSTDNSAKIAKSYIKDHPEFKYYHKPNGGLASAKNFGLSKATGEYIVFMDSDDKIKPQGYITMLKKALNTKADMVICDIELYGEGTQHEFHTVFHDNQKNKLLGFMVDGLVASSNNKIIKKSLYDQVGKYPEGKNNEDVAITPILLILAKNIQYIPSSFYRYYQHSTSIQNSEFNEKRLVIFDTTKLAIDEIKTLIPKKSDSDMLIGALVINQIINPLIYIIANIQDTEKRKSILANYCQKYATLGVNNNHSILKYCRDLGFNNLPYHILNSTPDQIVNYIKHQKIKKSYFLKVKRLFNI